MGGQQRFHRYHVGDEPVPGYRLVEWLGEGGFASVWKATSPGGVEVALKVIDLYQKASHKEVRALRLIKRIRHPNLCPILAFWQKDADGGILDDSDDVRVPPGSYVDEVDGPASQRPSRSAAALPEDGAARARLLSETLDVSGTETGPADTDTTGAPPSARENRAVQLLIAMGLGDGTLADRLEVCRADGLAGVPCRELLDYFEAAANAIDYLNTKHNIQHCDIKPQNILTVGGAAQVCDFGLAKTIGDNRKTSNALSIAYASPEVFDGKPPALTTDQYSLAISYFELRVGRLPFTHEEPTMSEILRVKTQGMMDLSALPEAEQEVIARAASFRPEDRFATNLEMVAALRRAQEGPSQATSSPRLRQIMTLVLLLIVLGVGWAISNVIPPKSTRDDGADDRFKLLQDRATDAWGVLSAGDLEKANSQFSFLADQLPDTRGPQADRLRAQVRLGLASYAARQGDWDRVQSQLDQLTKDRSFYSNALEVHYNVLRILARYGCRPGVRALDWELPGLDVQDPGVFLRDFTESWPLPAFDVRKLQQCLDAWERETTDQLLKRALARLHPFFSTTMQSYLALSAQDKENLDRAQALWPGDFEVRIAEALLDQAEARLGAGDVPGCAEAFAEAVTWAEKVEDAQFRPRCQSIKTLLMLKDREAPAAEVMAQLRAYVAGGDSHRLADVVSAAVAWAGHDLARAEDTVTALRELPNRDDLRGNSDYVRLLAVRLLGLDAPAPDDIADFLRQFDDPGPSPPVAAVVHACRAECLLLATEGNSLDDWTKANEAVAAAVTALATEPTPVFAGYVHYVQALVKSRDSTASRVGEAADDLLQSLQGESGSDVFRVPRRRDIAAEILARAASELRSTGDEDVTQPAYAPAAAQTAYAYLQHARDLELPTPSPGLLSNLALASFYKEPPDLELATQISDELLAHSEGTGQLLLLNAVAHQRRFEKGKTSHDLDLAIARYAKVLDRSLALRNPGDDTEEFENAVHKTIVAPALALAEALQPPSPAGPSDKKLGDALATIFATHGQLILRNYDLRTKYGVKGAFAALAMAIDRAASPKADYYIDQGRALIDLENMDLKEKLGQLEHLASDALKLDPGSQDAHGLLGYALVLRSRLEADAAARATALGRAIGQYDMAVSAEPDRDSQKDAQHLVGRSTAYVELAFLADDQNDKRTKLAAAARDAERASQIKTRRQLDYAWNAWGNALEDIAYYCGEPGAYDDAIDKFTRGVMSAAGYVRPSATSLLNRGRCRLRKASSGGMPKPQQMEIMKDALADLKKALDEHTAGAVNDPREHAEILLWMGQLHKSDAYQSKDDDKFHQALAELRQAADLAGQHELLEWPDYQVHYAELWFIRSLAAQEGGKKGWQKTVAEYRDKARSEAQAVLDRETAMVIRPDQTLRAMIVTVLATDTIEQRCDLIGRYLEQFPADKSASQNQHVQLLLLRGEEIGKGVEPGKPLPSRDRAQDDAAAVIASAGKMADSLWARHFQRRAVGILGIAHMDRYFENQKVDDLLRAAEELREALLAADDKGSPGLSDVLSWHSSHMLAMQGTMLAWGNYTLVTLPRDKLTDEQHGAIQASRRRLIEEGKKWARKANDNDLLARLDRLIK